MGKTGSVELGRGLTTMMLGEFEVAVNHSQDLLFARRDAEWPRSVVSVLDYSSASKNIVKRLNGRLLTCP